MSGSGRSEMATRFIFGPSMLAIVAAVFWLDSTVMAERGMRGYLSAGVLGLMAIGGVYEYLAMLRKADLPVATPLLMIFSVALVASPFFFDWAVLDRALYPLVIGTLGLLFPVALSSLSKDNMARGPERMAGTMLGFVMIGWTLYLAQGLAIRHLPSVLFVVLVCKGGDIGAYLFGVSFGKHKLIPHISGGKTWEGSVGSMLTSAAIAVGLRSLLLGDVPIGLTGTILVGIMLNITTQTGDLIESLLKRRCGVKDSSNLLPAHGGVLDLVDSLLFSFPAWFLVLAAIT